MSYNWSKLLKGCYTGIKKGSIIDVIKGDTTGIVWGAIMGIHSPSLPEAPVSELRVRELMCRGLRG